MKKRKFLLTIAALAMFISDILADNITGTINGYAYVDLGLSVKWATMNIGASNIEEHGDHFAWAEPTAQRWGFELNDYKWYSSETTQDSEGFDHTESGFTKYVLEVDKVNLGFKGFYDNKTIMENADDAAYNNWGKLWHVPTVENFQELLDKCSWTKASYHNVEGYKVTGPNGNWIFLPQADIITNSGQFYSNYWGGGGYWTSSLSSTSNEAKDLVFLSNDYGSDITPDISNKTRDDGLSIRAVTNFPIDTITMPYGMKYTTYDADYDADYISSGFTKVYTISIDDVADTLIYTAVTDVIPAGTAVLVEGTNSSSYELKPSISDGIYPTTSLRCSDGTIVGDGQHIYVLSTSSTYGPGFYRLEKGTIIPEGECYLYLSRSSLEPTRDFYGFNGVTNGIRNVESSTTLKSVATYNLQGKRIGKNYKGIVLTKGHKYIQK